MEHGNKELEVDFEIDDETAAHARLADAIAKFQKLVKKPERSPAKAADPVRQVTPPAAGGAK